MINMYIHSLQACIDIREAVVFWATMRTLTEMHLLPPELSWISSHPSHGDREKKLNEEMTTAIELRKDSGVCYLTYINTIIIVFINYLLQIILHFIKHTHIHTYT